MIERRHQLVTRRKTQGFSQESLAEAVGVTPHTIYRWERGECEPVPYAREPLARALDLSLHRLDRLLRNEDQESTEAATRPLLPEWLSTYVSLEQSASRVEAFMSNAVHALLQTTDYARAILRVNRQAGHAERVEKMVGLRVARQEAVRRGDDPMELTLVLSEAALRTVVGGGATMFAQLNQVADMGELPNVTVQVLPFASGPHNATCGNYTMLSFPWGMETGPSTVYVESYAGGASYIESPREIEPFVVLFADLRRLALSSEESVAFIRRLAKDLDHA